ncbi:hypothetical protein QL093DRAFT_2090116 [Fusarium oxysporum]|nr:hypothetical protein QL093DRAFT_2090116 [Fusarium oxysporum]
MSSPYYHCLAPGVYDGVIDGIQVRWQPAAIPTLDQDALTHGVPVDTLKRMCEHLGHLLARQLRSSRATIKAGPHSFSVDSRTGKKTDDGDHITVEVSGGEYGRRKCHVYLEGHGQGEGKYDNIRMRAVSVMDKKGKEVDRDLSVGNVRVAGLGAAAGNTGSSSSGQGGTYSGWQLAGDGRTYIRYNYGTQGWEDQVGRAWGGGGSGAATSGASAWGSTYGTTAGGAGSSSSGQGGTYSDWQLAGDGRTYIRYNYGTQGWEDQAGQAWGGN